MRQKAAIQPTALNTWSAGRVFDLRWQYFRGNHAQAFKPTADGVNDNITENHIKVIVNTTVNFLFGKLPSFEIDSDVKEQTEG